LDVKIVKEFDSNPQGFNRINVPLKDYPYITDTLQDNSDLITRYYLCYKKDTKPTPDAATEVLLDINISNSQQPETGYTRSNYNLNNAAIEEIETVGDSETITPNPLTHPIPNFGKRSIMQNSFQNIQSQNLNTVQSKNQNQNRNVGQIEQNQNQNQLFLDYKIGFPVTTTQPTTTIPTTTATNSPSITESVVQDKKTENPNDGLSPMTKLIMVIAVVAVTGAFSLVIFMLVNRRRHVNEEREKEQLFATLPWKTINNNVGNTSFDPIYGASLPQMENALNNSLNNGYPETSLNRNAQQQQQQQNTFNRNNAAFGTAMTSNPYGTMNSNTYGTMNSNAYGTMNNMQSYVPMGSVGPGVPMGQMGPSMPMNQNYQQQQQQQQQQNDMVYLNQQNNLSPSTGQGINAGLNITLSTSPLSNASNANGNVNPSTTYTSPNYNPNYQPTIPLSNQPQIEITYNNTSPQEQPQSQSSSQNDNNQNTNDTNNTRQPNSVKKKLYVTNKDENNSDDEEPITPGVDDDSQKLLDSAKYPPAEQEEVINLNTVPINESTLNLPSHLQIENTFENSLNLTPIKGSSIKDLVDENNIIDPKRLSKRTSTLNKMNQIDQNSMNLTDGDPNIPVIAGYDARDIDELTLQLGDKITVKAVYSDGWGIGINNTTNEQGVFPIVCLARKPNLLPIQ